ncbi:MAG: hypothetical protein OEW87_13035 [Flavobacteriaceae bacterium]|nr:hypothetical protein [Flavobacteriaceae bacterium]MDH5563793.1 hypothetical protein [Nitrospirota bacterium]
MIIGDWLMKTIFYICTKPIKHWEIFTPPETFNESSSDISVLLLDQEQDLPNIHASQIWKLALTEGDISTQNISYQGFLEQIFLHDLSLVI